MALAEFLLHSTYAASQPAVVGYSHGKPIKSCINKKPIATAVTHITATGLAADCQQDLEVHGGTEKAVYAWPMRNYQAWAQTDHGTDLLSGMTPEDPYHGGHFGENLLLSGDYATEEIVRIGDVWAWGSCMLEVTMPREPCFKLVAHLGGASARWMVASGRCGWYLKLTSMPGPVPSYGTKLELLQVGQGPTIMEAFRAKMERNGNRPHPPR